MKKQFITKQFIATLCILAVVGVAVGVGVEGADVDVTVTPQIVSVTVANGSVDYGVVAANSWNDTIDGTASGQQVITSASNVSTDIALRSSDAAKAGSSGVTDWDLVAAAAPDDFVHSYEINTAGASSASWTAFPFDGTFDNIKTASLVTLSNNGNTATLDLRIDMPTTISDTTDHSIDVTVVATAT